MRSVPEDNLAYPVLLQGNTGSTGSGFLLRSANTLYLITAKHVLFDRTGSLLGSSVTATCQSQRSDDEGVHKFTIDLLATPPVVHSTADVVAIKMGSNTLRPDGAGYFTQMLAGVTQVQTAVSGLVCVDVESVKLLGQVLVSNDVFLFGYPVSLGLSPSVQFEFDRPLLRKGVVANTYRKQGTIILDCAGYAGNSGGPVVELEQVGFVVQYRLIGVLSEFIPQKLKRYNSHTGKEIDPELANSGYSVAVSMNKVFELIGLDPTTHIPAPPKFDGSSVAQATSLSSIGIQGN